MKGPFSVLVHHRAPPGPRLLVGPCTFCSGGLWALRVAQRGGSRKSTLPSCLPYLVSPIQPRPIGGVPLPHRARACPVLLGSCCVPEYTRLMQCRRNLERTFLSVPTPPSSHPTTAHLHCTAPAGCSTTGQWAPAMLRPIHYSTQHACAHLRIRSPAQSSKNAT